MFIIIITFVLPIYPQKKLSGKYIKKQRLNDLYEFLDFSENGIFEYEEGADLGKTRYGKGHYYIKNDRLVFNYDLTPLKEESFFKLKKYYTPLKDSIQIQLNIFDFNKNPLPKTQIWPIPMSAGKATLSDNQGIARLRFIKNKINKIYINHEFYSNLIICIDSKANYIINVFMSKTDTYGLFHPKPIKNQIIIYKIIDFKKSFFTVMNKDGDTTTWKKIKE